MTDEEKNIFGNQLRERRNELNLTTQKVALDAEVGESTYKRLEAGDGNPRLDTLVKIVKCLKTDLNSVVPQEHLCKDAGMIIPGLSEPPVRTLRATIPENGSHIFR